MNTHTIFQLLLTLLIIVTTTSRCGLAVHHPSVGGRAYNWMRRSYTTTTMSEQVPPDFEVHNYTQTLDHFNYRPESYETFRQRYVVNSKYWGGANSSSPIFVYLGAEVDVTFDLFGFIIDLASRFKGLLLYIEHRYYGESMPFGSEDEALKNSSSFGYLSSEQALADYAEVILDLKKNLSAENCPVVALGGSYGGMLASWFRLKYPHIVIGALASSAPILYFDDITPENGYHVVITNDFKEASESCYSTIKQSWTEIDRVAAQSNGILTLSNTFNTCRPLNSSDELKYYLEMVYVFSAQYDNPPQSLVRDICNAMDGAPQGTDTLGRVVAGLNASYYGNLFRKNFTCHEISFHAGLHKDSPWDWQTCTEMVMPIGHGDNDTMFPASPFDINNYTKNCVDVFGVVPNPHWVTTQFGGHDIKTVLEKFGSNIIFSNGLRDPYSAGGVVEDISDTIVAVHTDKGAHCLDLYPPAPSDPDWLVAQRDTEIRIIAFWIAQYYAKLTG